MLAVREPVGGMKGDTFPSISTVSVPSADSLPLLLTCRKQSMFVSPLHLCGHGPRRRRAGRSCPDRGQLLDQIAEGNSHAGIFPVKSLKLLLV